MVDVAKYHLLSTSNGGSLFADLRRPFSLLKRQAVLSGFFIVFVGLTLILAFSSSYSSSSSSSPWFHGVLSSTTAANYSNSADSSSSGRHRSDLPSLPSSYFPGSPPQTPPKISTLPRSVAPPTLERNSPTPPAKRSESRSKVGLNSTTGVPVEKSSGKNAKVVREKVESNFTASLSKKKQGSGGGERRNATITMPLESCDLYDGRWVRDYSYPLYEPGSCGLIDEHFNCFANGRPDDGYLKFKWKPRGCKLPRFDGARMLKLLQGKRLVFVGDSINRNMWESLICILRTSVKDQKRVFEAHGRHQFRTEAVYSFVFEDYNFTVEFFVSPFLVRQWEVKEKNGETKETLRIDLIAESASKFKSADILVFNTGHWWTHWKTSSGKDYYQEGNHVYGELNVTEAFQRALRTWASWVDANVNPAKTHVLFRGYSHSHFSGGQWNSGGACDNETEPILSAAYLREYPLKDKVLESTFKKMKTPVTYLNVTMLTDYRKDGHPSIYRKQNIPEEERRSPLQYQDCSHWCLPGVPDAWNELLYAELLRKQRQQ